MRGVEQIPWIYDPMMAVMERMGLRRWRAWLARGVRGRTLEVGCGTGRNLPNLSVHAEVVGVDPSPDALRKARERAPDVPLVRASAEALPFKTGAFQTVVSALVFCSVADPQAGLHEVKRVLQPDGRLRMMEHVRSRKRFGQKVQDLIDPVWCWAAGGCHPNRDTESHVEAAGFDIEPEGRRATNLMRRFSARARR